MTKHRKKLQLVAGDCDPVTFGGCLIDVNLPTTNNQCGNNMYFTYGIDLFNHEKRTVVIDYWKDKNDYSKGLISYEREYPAFILLYRIDIEYQDPLNTSWVNWEDVLQSHGLNEENEDSKTFASKLSAWERIYLAAEYYGWENFDSYPCEFTESQLRNFFRSYYSSVKRCELPLLRRRLSRLKLI